LEYKLNTHDGIDRARKEAEDFFATQPYKFMKGFKNVNSNGEYVFNSNNARDMYVGNGCENTRYCQFISMKPVSDCYDYTEWGDTASRVYESVTVGQGVDNIRFCWGVWVPGCMNNEYCMYVNSSKDMFGCIGMKKKEYCILNKQYSKEEFESLRERIIKDMTDNPYIDEKGRVFKYGEFFPYDLSLCAYNESTAAQYFPMEKEDVLEKGWKWYDGKGGEYTITKRVEDLPSDIEETDDSILADIIECPDCKKAYRIVKAELELLRRFQFPIPRKCPNCRHADRLSRMSQPYSKRKEICMCKGERSSNGTYENKGTHPSHDKNTPCGTEFETSYAKDGKHIIYCDSCYLSEVA